METQQNKKGQFTAVCFQKEVTVEPISANKTRMPIAVSHGATDVSFVLVMHCRKGNVLQRDHSSEDVLQIL